MTDLVQRLRESATQARALDRSELLNEAADEIVKIRREVADFRGGLTREAVRFCATASLPETEKLGGVAGELCRLHAATMRGLLERTK